MTPHSLCSRRNELMDLLRRVKEVSEKKCLLFNTKKTKIMVIDKQSSGEDFLLDGQVIKEVSEFGYLGSVINTKSDSATEIKTQIGNCKNNHSEYTQHMEKQRLVYRSQAQIS